MKDATAINEEMLRSVALNARRKAEILCEASDVKLGYSFIQVKTVQMGKYKSYDDTNRFYISIGFKEFEVFPTLWDKWNPCQIYVMGI